MEKVLKCCCLHLSSGTTGVCTIYRIHHPWSITWIVALTSLNMFSVQIIMCVYVCVAGQQCTQRTTTPHSQGVTDNLPLSSPVHPLSHQIKNIQSMECYYNSRPKVRGYMCMWELWMSRREAFTVTNKQLLAQCSNINRWKLLSQHDVKRLQYDWN